MMAEWPTLALYWYAPARRGAAVDPIFGRPLTFYLFTLPAWQLLAGWLTDAGGHRAASSPVFFVVITGGTRVLGGGARRRRRDRRGAASRSRSRRLLIVLASQRLPRPLRAAVRRPHDLRRRHLHRRARHADRPARRRRSRWCVGAVDRRSSTRSPRRALRWLVAAVVPAAVVLRRRRRRSAGTSAASSSSRTSWCASGRTSRTTSR